MSGFVKCVTQCEAALNNLLGVNEVDSIGVQCPNQLYNKAIT